MLVNTDLTIKKITPQHKTPEKHMILKPDRISFSANSKNGIKLAKYISSLPDFKLQTEIDGNYHHIGATLTDMVLQAGLDYKNVVKPKVISVLEQKNLQTVDGFLQLVDTEGLDGIKKVLHWKDDEKPKRMVNIARLLKTEKVNTEDELKLWLQSPDSTIKLRSIKGIGPKTIDYAKELTGIPATAIDRHLFGFIANAGIQLTGKNHDVRYNQANEIICTASKILGIERSIFDYSIWSYMSGKARAK